MKLKTGHTPKTVIDHYVIMQLKLLLRTGKDSIKEIAWQYHFNDDSFFCRYFKFRTGVSPQQFRNRIT
ncbi:helix-turn-helix domain-containing protein [Hoylesella oralis]|uniref:helix-turn-helix domain-containing protein n=1 Tax=Hoylesella oralis TaxID=28134 RepID=UPI0005615943|nr:helix-turn-helix domain-containing protein [Hoylesella oralis]